MQKVLGVLFLVFWGAQAFAKDHITNRSFFEDVSGSIPLERLPQEDFTPFTNILNRGYSSSTFWIRLHVDPEGITDKLILRIRPVYLDEVRLYDPESSPLGQEVRGDGQLNRDRYESLNLNFTIPAGGRPRDIWLRVRTTSTMLFACEVVDWDEAVHTDAFQQLKAGFYLSLIGLFIVWGGFNWWATRDEVIALYVLSQVLAFIHMFGMLGYMSFFWPRSWTIPPGSFVDLAMAPYGAAAFWFEYRFLRGFRPNRFLLSILRWMPCFLPIFVVLLAVGESQWAFTLAMSLYAVAPFLFFALTLTVRSPSELEEKNRHLGTNLSRRVLIALYGVTLLGFSAGTLPAMGWVKAGFLTFDGLQIYSLISGLAILILLQLQIRSRENERIVLEIQHREVKKQVETERIGREEQALFLAMLTHELRTPMAAIRMSLGASDCESEVYSEAEQSIEEMVAILDRCLTTDRMDLGKIVPNFNDFRVSVELQGLVKRSVDSSRVLVHIRDDVQIRSDVMLFRIAIANLIDNALKFSRKPSMVQAEVEKSGALLLIKIENDPGKAGWPDPDQIFQKYYRSPRAQRVSGTGLGLYLARKLIQSLGGDIQYTPSATRIGFTLCLPL